MQDRIPLYPGRVRLIPVNGQANTFDMVRADEPTEAGTPLNKACLFSDEAAMKYPSGTDTPNRAFEVLGEERPQIGDTLTTLRANLGSNWLLCDGSSIDPLQYPALAEVLASSGPAGTWVASKSNGLTGGGDGRIAYGNGYFVIGSYGSGRDITIAYSTDAAGPWTKTQLIAAEGRITGVTFANGLFFVGTTLGAIFYTEDPSSGWTRASVGNSSYWVYDVAYGDGYYVAVGSTATSGRACYFYATEPSGPWTMVQVNWTTVTQYTVVIYANGQFVFGGSPETTSVTSVYVMTTPGSHTAITIDSAASASIFGLAYGDGYYVAYVGTKIYYATDLRGEWQQSSTTVTSTNNQRGKVKFCAGYFLLPIRSALLYTKNPAGSWETLTAGSTENEDVDFGSDSFIMLSSSAAYYNKKTALPSVAIDILKTYIKAAEV